MDIVLFDSNFANDSKMNINYRVYRNFRDYESSEPKIALSYSLVSFGIFALVSWTLCKSQTYGYCQDNSPL